MINIEKLKDIEKTLDKTGELIVSIWLLRKNGWIYTFRETEEYKNSVIDLLNENNVNYTFKNNMIGEMLVLV